MSVTMPAPGDPPGSPPSAANCDRCTWSTEEKVSPTTGAVTVERVREDCVDPSCKESWFYHRAAGRVSRFREHIDDDSRPLPPLPPRRSQGESFATTSGSRFREHLDDDDPIDSDVLLPRPPGPVPVRRRPNKLQKVRRKPLPPLPTEELDEEIRKSRDKAKNRDHETSSVRTVAKKVGQSVQAVLALPKAGVDLVKSAVSSVVARIKSPLPPLPPLPPMPSWQDFKGFAGKGVGFLGKGLGNLAPFSWQGSYKFRWR